MLMYNVRNELYHHGIKGMKWGVRRFQTKSGSLTPAGKKRYSSDNVKSMSTDELRKKVNRMNQEQRYIELTKKSSFASKAADGIDKGSGAARDATKTYKALKGDKDPKGKIAGQAVEGIARSSKLIRKVDNAINMPKQVRAARKKLDSMSDQDLSREVERLDLERQYSNLQKSTINSGRVKASEILSIAGDVVAIGASAVTIAVGMKKLMEKK